MKVLLLGLLAVMLASAQLPISVGVKAGYVNNSRPGAEITPFKGGPYVELNLPVLPTIESGILFERFSSGGQSATIYQVPILLKKRFNTFAIKPFFSGGTTIRRVPQVDSTHAGLTVAGGLTFSLLPIKVEPEIRYTRWFQSSLTPRSQQTEFLVGFRF
jgi:hypothetical protein